MIKLFSNRELAQHLGINLSRWKRWSREFLAPDPLAGKQAGYARQYYVNDAFTVFLGGCLVCELGFSIPEARQILLDIEPWLKAKGFRCDARGKAMAMTGLDEKVRRVTLTILCRQGSICGYRLKGVVSDLPGEIDGHEIRRCVYNEEIINKNGSKDTDPECEIEKAVVLTSLFKRFLNQLDPKGLYFSCNGRG